MKRVLVLGSGFVAAPFLEDLLGPAGDPGASGEVTLDLASLEPERGRTLLAGRPRAQAHHVDVTDEARLAQLARDADLVVSLLPADLHHHAARVCVETRTPLLTPSYARADLRALDRTARDRGVLLLCECGLDPGLDHVLASRTIRRVTSEEGDVVSFVSCASGLPTPEHKNGNPWGYKVSWSPKGVLLAACQPVRWIEDEQVIETSSPFDEPGPRPFDIEGIGRLEAFPKQDSVPYRELYGLDRARDVFRGSVRYPGWCETMKALLDLGYLTPEPEPIAGATWADLLRRRVSGAEDHLRSRIAQLLELPESHTVIGRLAWLGLLDDEPLPDELGEEASPLDALAWRLRERLSYRDGEKDLIALEQRIVAEDGRHSRRKRIRTRLVVRGEAGDHSAMARAVGLTMAAAARQVLAGRVHGTGVQLPVAPELADAILADVEARGLACEETIEE